MTFAAAVAVGRVMDDATETKLMRLTVEVRVKCSDCGADLAFQGLPVGVDTHGPTCSVDGLEARLVATIAGEPILPTGRVAAIFRSPGGKA